MSINALLAIRRQVTNRIAQYHNLAVLVGSPKQISKSLCKKTSRQTANWCRSRNTWGVALVVHHLRGMTSPLPTPTPQLQYSIKLSSREILPDTMSRVEKQNQQIQEIVSSNDNDDVKIDQVAKVRGWFQPEEGSYFFAVVQDYLKEKLKLEDAAKKILTPIDEKIAAERLDDVNFMDLWFSILHAARRTHYRDADIHISIVRLVAAFKEHSIPNNEQYNYLHNEQTDLLMACREAYNDQPTPGSSFEVENQAWSNLNFFLALLVREKLADNFVFAIWAMRQALETPHQDDEDSTAVQKYETYVPAAAVWVFGAHHALFEKQEDLTPKDKKHGNPGRGGELWKGKAEFSHARWNFWKDRFAEIATMDGLSEDTKVVAKDAVESMERAATFEKM
ncbi:hypothetical protein HBI23_183420 [Parastagonospora nodorum]|nr:hypothetical protein HBI12_171640 [Parastagonospora nodorum]KAH5435108.1 hypothetical protein HBI47_078400 [Parastagonospora nodorum]KAH5647216.1 hypothetical protein HBI23_183420 [Parastagonospora nodorum]